MERINLIVPRYTSGRYEVCHGFRYGAHGAAVICSDLIAAADAGALDAPLFLAAGSCLAVDDRSPRLGAYVTQSIVWRDAP